MEKLFIMQMPILDEEHAETIGDMIRNITKKRVSIETYVVTEDYLDIGVIRNTNSKKDIVRLLNILLTQGYDLSKINKLKRLYVSEEVVYIVDGDDLNDYEEKMIKLIFENYFSFSVINEVKLT